MVIKNTSIRASAQLTAIILVLLFLNSCEKERVSIETTQPYSEQMRIETTEVPVHEDAAEKTPKEPSLKVTSPKDLETVPGKELAVKLEVLNFKLTLPGLPAEKGEGFIKLWLDSTEKKSASTEFIFRDLPSGRHSIVAELRNYDDTPLSPRAIQAISVNIKNPEIEEFNRPKLIIAEADDFGFYPPSINVKKLQPISLNITVRKENVYFNGLDFESKHFKTGKILPGKSAITQFSADDNFKVVSYWPSTKAKKAELEVVVE